MMAATEEGEMIRYYVCKTRVAFPEASQFVLISERDTSNPIRTYAGLRDVAVRLRDLSHPSETFFVKNNVVGDIIWRPDRKPMMVEPLTRDEVYELSTLLAEE